MYALRRPRGIYPTRYFRRSVIIGLSFCRPSVGLKTHIESHSVFFQLFSVFTKTEGTHDDVLLTEDLLIESMKMQRINPAFGKIVVDFLLIALTPMKVDQKGFFSYDEYRRLFENVGFIDTVFTLDAFVKIDTNHDGKVSIAEFIVGAYDYMCSDDENSTAAFGLLA